MTDMSLVSKFDVGDIGIEALLFQTGYLTIAEEQRDEFDILFKLDYPNLAVRLSLNDELLRHLGKSGWETLEQGWEFCTLLKVNDFEGFGERLRAYLSGIPYQWHATGDLARYEAWYASLLYMCFRSIGVDLRMEGASSDDRADMVVLTGGQVFVLEFKMAEGKATRPLRWTRRSRRCGGGAMRRSTVTAGSRSTWSAWRADARQRTSWRSEPRLPEPPHRRSDRRPRNCRTKRCGQARSGLRFRPSPRAGERVQDTTPVLWPCGCLG